jgi:hypothetical protein
MTKVQSHTAAAVLALLFALPMTGQDMDFTGKWVIDKERTELAGLPDLTIEISVTEDVIDFKKTQTSQPRNIVWHMILSPDGREGTYTSVRGNELTCSGQIVEGKLVILSVSEATRDGRLVFRDVREEYSLSADGNVLFLSHRSSLDGQTSTLPKPIIFNRVIG